MVDFSAIIQDAWILFIISAITTLIIFPIVVITSFLNDSLKKKYPKTPKILLTLISTFIGTLIGVTVAFLYLKDVFLPLAQAA
ncbi:MAG: hypothetical protein ACE5DI_03920 [Candidatus Micrarchaeia archaeon]